MLLTTYFDPIKSTFTVFYLKYIGESQYLLDIFNSILPLLVSLLTLVAVYIFYNRNKYAISYKLENPSEIDTSPKSVNNILENCNSIFFILKYLYGSSFLIWIFWSFCLTIIYLIYGYIFVKVSIAIIISLHIYFPLELNIILYRIQLEEGKKISVISLYTYYCFLP